MNLRHALRSLRRTPVFSVTVVLTLTLGLGASGAMFALVHGILLAPLPYGEPERLVSLGLQSDARPINQAPAMHVTYQRFARRIEGVALYRTGNTNVWTEGAEGEAASVVATWVSASMMPLLQVPPLLGRSFDAGEERRGGPDAVILSESEWRTRFAAAKDVIGRTLVVNSVPREIVGVMPARFSFPDARTRLWLPVKYTDDARVGDFLYSGIARLAPGATAEQAQRELAAVLPRIAESFPQLHSGSPTLAWLREVRPTPVVRPLHDEITGGIARTLWMLASAAALVLLVAWANVANLMLVRADARRQEFALREALGAGRVRRVAALLAESALLGLIATALALLAAQLALGALVAFGPADVPRLAEVRVGVAAAGFVTATAFVGMLLCVAVPLLHERQGTASTVLHDGARGQTAGASRQRLRATIAVLQIAIALLVLIGSALLLRTAHRLHQVQPGFDADGVTTLRILLPLARYRDATTVAFHARLIERLAGLPSVAAAGLTMHVPLDAGGTLWHAFDTGRGDRSMPLPVNVVSPGYFATMGIPLLAGRDFRDLGSEQARDLILSRRAAAMLFGDVDGTSVVGSALRLAPDGAAHTVVGVVGDVRDRALETAPSALVYRAQAVPVDPATEPSPRPAMALVVKSEGEPDVLVPAIRRIVHELDPAVPVFAVSQMRDVVRASTARLSLTLALTAAAAVVTLLLGMIGLYGVMAYLVGLRTREFGIRLALGADPARIAASVVGRGLVLGTGGIAAGLLLYAAVAPALRAFLYGVTVCDPVSLIAAIALLAGTTMLASWLPARRAAGVDPAQALRAE